MADLSAGERDGDARIAESFGSLSRTDFMDLRERSTVSRVEVLAEAMYSEEA